MVVLDALILAWLADSADLEIYGWVFVSILLLLVQTLTHWKVLNLIFRRKSVANLFAPPVVQLMVPAGVYILALLVLASAFKDCDGCLY